MLLKESDSGSESGSDDDDDEDSDDSANWASDSSSSSDSDDSDDGFGELKGRARWLKKTTVVKEKVVKDKGERAKARAEARPIPAPAAVVKAVFPLNRMNVPLPVCVYFNVKNDPSAQRTLARNFRVFSLWGSPITCSGGPISSITPW